MANSWLRLWHEMPNDPKWRTIARISKEPIPSVLAIYVHLLVEASQSTVRGEVKASPEDLSSALGIEPESVAAIIEAMQGRVLEGNKLTGWDKRQPAREDNSYDRVKRFREKKRDVTQGNAPSVVTLRDSALHSECNSDSADVTQNCNPFRINRA